MYNTKNKELPYIPNWKVKKKKKEITPPGSNTVFVNKDTRELREKIISKNAPKSINQSSIILPLRPFALSQTSSELALKPYPLCRSPLMQE